MLMSLTRRAVAITAAAIIVGAMSSVHPATAVAGDPQLAQGAPPSSSAKAPAATKSAGERRTPAEFIDARIKALHERLKITPAEEPQWRVVAQVMRDNAKTIRALIVERIKTEKTMSAPDNLLSYRAIAKAHLDGIEKLIPAFEALYAKMPEAQKKIADSVFDRRPMRPRHGKRG